MSTWAMASLPASSTVKRMARGPARVSTVRLPRAASTMPRSTTYFAKQRTPLPHIWAKVPSALM